MNLYVYTLGCRVNQCESESIANCFELSQWKILKDASQQPDLIIVNTCTVTSKAEQKARRMIRIFAKQCLTIVTGCYANKELEKLSDNIIVLPIIYKPLLLKLPKFLGNCSKEQLKQNICKFINAPVDFSVFDYSSTDFSYHCRSYLKIQDGCDNNCGYCRTRIVRGPSVFLNAESVVQRALEIEKLGYHEIVLTGVNLTMYDHNGAGLGGLLEKLLFALGDDVRIRLSSMEPDNIDDCLLSTLKDKRMLPYFHIPVQSASEKVMKRINRNYSKQHLEYIVDKIRAIKDDPLLACDVITGLPSETDEDFEITRRFLIDNGFSLFHVFPFSPRPETALYRAKDRPAESVRDKRAQILRELSTKQYNTYIQRQIGKQNEVILEEYKNGKWYGTTGNYIKVEVANVPNSALCGDLRKIILKTESTAVCV